MNFMGKIKSMKKKPAQTVGLTTSKPRDIQSIENLTKLAEALPGCSDVTSAVRWLCEEEIPKVIERLNKVFPKAS